MVIFWRFSRGLQCHCTRFTSLSVSVRNVCPYICVCIGLWGSIRCKMTHWKAFWAWAEFVRESLHIFFLVPSSIFQSDTKHLRLMNVFPVQFCHSPILRLSLLPHISVRGTDLHLQLSGRSLSWEDETGCTQWLNATGYIYTENQFLRLIFLSISILCYYNLSLHCILRQIGYFYSILSFKNSCHQLRRKPPSQQT